MTAWVGIIALIAWGAVASLVVTSRASHEHQADSR